MIRNPEPENGVAVELTPIIDMVFLLLIFFLIATTFHQTEREMQIALPSAAAASPISTTLREIIINVDAEGNIVVSGRSVEPDALGAMITEAVANNPEQKVTVRGDRNTSYANIVRVLDVCKGSGIREPYLDTVVIGSASP
ncbi:MAG: biopolymer transporter ExbD [Planctomycetes bacterium]|nr:biopolymer transporter ExbD [Planctomycetota bacterium]